jgi:hypothetical protein
MTIKPPQRYGTRIILISFMVLVAMVLFAPSAIGAPDYVAGDVNGDGKIDVRDVVLAQKHILKIQNPPLTAVQLSAADVNGDGEIDVSDVVAIMKIALGIVESYPMPILSLNDAVVRVPIYTALADINLPSTVEANFAGGLKRNIGVRWERVSTPAYNPFVFDEYIFKGDLINLPSGVRNPTGLRATARVSFLLRDPWPPSDSGYFLFIQINPPGAGTVTGAGNYTAGTRVNLSAAPNPGFAFQNWTRDGVVVSTSRNFTYTMPSSNVMLFANFTGGPDPWPIELDGPPAVVFDQFANRYVVTMKIKDQFVASVNSITVRGEPATQRPDPRFWRVLFVEQVGLDDLIGRIEVNSTPVGAIDVINVAGSSALFDSILSGTWIRVQIQPGKSADLVRAGGVTLTYDAVNNRWNGFVTGYSPGDPVTIVASNLLGMQTISLIVQPDTP